MNTKITAKDFFLQLGAMAALYAGAIALINLLFRVINAAFPQVQNGYNNYYYYGNPISLPVAILIVVTPVFMGLSWYMQRTYAADPTLKDTVLRRWLVYVTLFVAGVVVSIDLITVLYQFLDGQEITTGFLLKVLSVLVVAGGVFGYYLSDLRGRLNSQNRMVWRISAIILVVGSIIAGFMVIGSPATQRAYRYDSERVMHLEQVQGQVINYWQMKRALPADLTVLTGSDFSGWTVPTDPATKAAYEYEKTGDLSFKVCANFSRATPENLGNGGGYYSRPAMDIAVSSPAMKGANTWEHGVGHTCFDRTIDPDFYPARKI